MSEYPEFPEDFLFGSATGDVACDTCSNFQTDIDHTADLSMNAYRLSP